MDKIRVEAPNGTQNFVHKNDNESKSQMWSQQLKYRLETATDGTLHPRLTNKPHQTPQDAPLTFLGIIRITRGFPIQRAAYHNTGIERFENN